MFIVPITQMPSVTSLGHAAQAKSESVSTEVPFSDVMKETYSSLAEQQEISAQDAYNMAIGSSDDLHTVMINSEIAATTLQLTVQLTAKALNAYNEIMRLQV